MHDLQYHGTARHPAASVGAAPRYRWRAAAVLLLAVGCGEDAVGPTIQASDRDRHPRFTADGQTIIYYRHDERPNGVVGIYRLDVATGDVELIVEAILAGLDLHPVTDSIVFSARVAGEAEPALWLMGPDGGGVRRLQGGASGPGHRWPAFSSDGTRLSWEARYQDATGVDTANTLWIGEWQGGTIQNARTVAPARRSAWRPDGAALAVELRRPGNAVPFVIATMDTTGQVLDTLGLGYEPIWRPDGATVAYGTEADADRGCLGVCFVPAGGGSPVPFSTAFSSFPGIWTRNGAEYVYARLMRTYEIATDGASVRVEESRLWIRNLTTEAERQLTF
ncbi:MAG TPA: hypothetical protein VGA02_15290 [Gemmatimonadales bacterium]|jgi:Tol biopolymer transport system component